jgi:hypothetical protein
MIIMAVIAGDSESGIASLTQARPGVTVDFTQADSESLSEAQAETAQPEGPVVSDSLRAASESAGQSWLARESRSAGPARGRTAAGGQLQ